MDKQPEAYQPGMVLLVLVTCPPEKADSIALDLLEAALATCINVIPLAKSYYRWQGKVQQDNESLMLIKCPADSYMLLEQRIMETHPYELPEIIAVPISGGLPGYLDWVLCPDKNNTE